MWKVDYPRQHDRKSLDYDVLHVTELVADLLKQGAFEFTTPVKMSVTYHDSCRLARLSVILPPSLMASEALRRISSIAC